MKKRITRKMREEAARAHAVAASSRNCTVAEVWDAAGLEPHSDAWRLECAAFGYVLERMGELGEQPCEILYAEAESLLRTGWCPEGWE